MKIIKLFFVFTLVSMIAVSCKETKKEEVQDDTMEMTEEGTDAVGGSAEAEDASTDAATDAAAMEAGEAVEGASKGVEPIPVPEGVISEELAETPVIYPGCEGTNEEIRACNKKSYTEFLLNEFDDEIAKEANLEAGEYKISTLFHVDKTGKVYALRVTAPNQSLETEMKRVIAKVPQVTPATNGGEPVDVTFLLPITFVVK